mgnify:CR=1 FL=1
MRRNVMKAIRQRHFEILILIFFIRRIENHFANFEDFVGEGCRCWGVEPCQRGFRERGRGSEGEAWRMC